jgi:hypothetical protein
LEKDYAGCVGRWSVALFVSSIIKRLRLKYRMTVYATDTSRATATVLRAFWQEKINETAKQQ